MKPIYLKKEDIAKIKSWLLLDKDEKMDCCPLAEGISCEEVCTKLFRLKRVPNYPEYPLCPCFSYNVSYVARRVKHFMKTRRLRAK